MALGLVDWPADLEVVGAGHLAGDQRQTFHHK
jgi:hypothetical protein